jgi:DNA-binding transcriptional LysR family regulator
MRPRLEWLETFLAIAETGSLTRAGTRVARSQSAVSLQLHRLEEVLGVRLFDRDTRHVRLTPPGERLIPLARRALEAADAAVLALDDRPRRTVRVGVPEEYADRLIPEVLGETGRHDPFLLFEVECAASPELEHRVRQRRLDLAIVLAEEIEGQGRPICSDPVAWLEAPGRGLSGRRPLPVALFDQACSWRSKALDALQTAGIDYRVVFTSASVAGVRAGIRAGIAVGALARSTGGAGLRTVDGPDAPPSLPPAELVLLGSGVGEADTDPLIERVRTALVT